MVLNCHVILQAAFLTIPKSEEATCGGVGISNPKQNTYKEKAGPTFLPLKAQLKTLPLPSRLNPKHN